MHKIFSHLRGFMYYKFVGLGVDNECYFGSVIVGDGYGKLNGDGGGYGYGYGNYSGNGQGSGCGSGYGHGDGYNYGDGDSNDTSFSTEENILN